MAVERPQIFGTERNLVGIVTEPDVQPNDLAAIFLNAGVVHRVGPNRMYVNAARELARHGFVSVRFDLPGIGDSPARRDATPFEVAAVEETRQVMSRVQETYGVRGFVLAGLCSGAVVSFSTAVADQRVLGAVLINPQGFGGSPQLIAYVEDRGQTRRYASKLFTLHSWRRALTGRSDYSYAFRTLSRRWQTRRTDPAIAEFSRGVAGDFRTLADRGVAILLACSGGDYSLEYLDLVMGTEFRKLDRRGFQIVDLPAGDHSLTMRHSQERLMGALRPWAGALASSGAAARSSADAGSGVGYEVAAASGRNRQ